MSVAVESALSPMSSDLPPLTPRVSRDAVDLTVDDFTQQQQQQQQ